jgi:hypothetical protein
VVLPRVERLFAVNWTASKSKYVVTPTVAAEELAVAITKKIARVQAHQQQAENWPDESYLMQL